MVEVAAVALATALFAFPIGTPDEHQRAHLLFAQCRITNEPTSARFGQELHQRQPRCPIAWLGVVYTALWQLHRPASSSSSQFHVMAWQIPSGLTSLPTGMGANPRIVGNGMEQIVVHLPRQAALVSRESVARTRAAFPGLYAWWGGGRWAGSQG